MLSFSALAQAEWSEAKVAMFEREIERHAVQFAEQVALLDTIPGIDRIAACASSPKSEPTWRSFPRHGIWRVGPGFVPATMRAQATASPVEPGTGALGCEASSRRSPGSTRVPKAHISHPCSGASWSTAPARASSHHSLLLPSGEQREDDPRARCDEALSGAIGRS